MKKKIKFYTKREIINLKTEYKVFILTALYDAMREYKKLDKTFKGIGSYKKKCEELKELYKLLRKADI